MSDVVPATVGGVQAVRRATQILTAISRRSPTGLTLAELSRRTDLPHPTAHRLLRCLIEAQLVVQDTNSRRYLLGPLVFEFGLCTPHESILVRAARPSLERIAKATGDAVHLVVRSGIDAVCLDKVEASYPIRVMVIGIGDRRPLGIGAAGLAMLAKLEETEISTVLRENNAAYEEYGLDQRRLNEAILGSRQQGYGISDGLINPGIAGIGVALLSTRGSPIAGISVASTRDRIFHDRLNDILYLIEEEIDSINVIIG